MAEALFNLLLDDEDRALLDACSRREKLTKADVVRRAIRDYAVKLGVEGQPKRAKARSKRK